MQRKFSLQQSRQVCSFWKEVFFYEIPLHAETVTFVAEVIEKATEGFQKIISILMSWKLVFH